DHVVIASHDPEAGTAWLSVLEDRRVVTQPGEPLMRHALLKTFGVDQIDLGWIHGAVLHQLYFAINLPSARGKSCERLPCAFNHQRSITNRVLVRIESSVTQEETNHARWIWRGISE